VTIFPNIKYAEGFQTEYQQAREEKWGLWQNKKEFMTCYSDDWCLDIDCSNYDSSV